MLGRMVMLGALAVGGTMLAKKWNNSRAAGGKSSAREMIDVELPVNTVYNQWTQFEEFPHFMESVHEVRQLDDKRLHWKADVFGKTVEWDAEISEQIPDKKIAWHSITGKPNGGEVSFAPLGSGRTRVTLTLHYEPEGAVESIGDMLGAVRLQAKANLRDFKKLMEQRGHETGAWRSSIPKGNSDPVRH